jgi:Na+/melibiose symporter-like transporter
MQDNTIQQPTEWLGRRPDREPADSDREEEMMATTRDLTKTFESRDQRLMGGPALIFIAAVAATAIAAGFAARAMSTDVVLPLVSASLFVFAAAIALAAWPQRKAHRQAGPTYWDVAGALTLIGICAAALVDPDQMVGVMFGTR